MDPAPAPGQPSSKGLSQVRPLGPGNSHLPKYSPQLVPNILVIGEKAFPCRMLLKQQSLEIMSFGLNTIP